MPWGRAVGICDLLSGNSPLSGIILAGGQVPPRHLGALSEPLFGLPALPCPTRQSRFSIPREGMPMVLLCRAIDSCLKHILHYIRVQEERS